MIKSLKNGDELVPIKYITFPVEKNKIILRVENIGDKFDGESEVAYVNLNELATYFW